MASVIGMVLTYRDAARSTSQLHFTTFWLSMLAALAVTLVAGVYFAKTNRSRLGVLTAFGMYTYLPKFMMSVNGPAYYDEFGQWRHVNDILRTGNLLSVSTYLPVLRYYPGLGIITTFVHEVTSLSTWHSGQLVILTSHCASLVLIFLLAGEVGLSSTGAFVAAVFFGLNPSFMYFDTQFAYESLGITLALLAVLCAFKSRRAFSARSSWGWAALGACFAGYCAVTHHISTAVMLAIVAAVALFVPPRTATWGNTKRAAKVSTWALVAAATAVPVIWTGLVAGPTIAYLSPYMRVALDQVDTLVRAGTSGSSSSVLHVPFSGVTSTSLPGGAAPDYERLAGYASPFIAFVVLCSAVLALRRLPRETARTMVPFLLLALAYLVSLPFALTAGGGEAAHRSWSFTYIGVSIVAAFGVQHLAYVRDRWPGWARFPAGAVGCIALAALCVGNVASGESVLYRFPGPYVFGSDTRSVTPELMTVAEWANDHLPSGSRVLSDRTSNEVLAGYTDLLTAAPTDGGAYDLYSSGPDISPFVRQLLSREGFEYFLLDTRVETQVPAVTPFPGYYGPPGISQKELDAMSHGPYTTLLYRSVHYMLFALHLHGTAPNHNAGTT